MLRLLSLLFFTFLLQNTVAFAQGIAGHWQNTEGAKVILTEEGVAKIDNTNGIHYGKWTSDNEQIILNLFSEFTPYTFSISDFFADLTYIGKGYIPEVELAIYRNGYQLDQLPVEEATEPNGTVSLDTQWLVTPRRSAGSHVATWQMEDGTQVDLTEWGAFSVFTTLNGISYGLFEIDGEIIRLQFLFHDGTYEYDLSSVVNSQMIGPSSLTPAEFQQAEQQMFMMLSSQVQSTNQVLTQMSSQMMEQMHQTTQKMIINLSGYDWTYEKDKRD